MQHDSTRQRRDRTDEAGDIALVEELVLSPCGLMLERIPTGQKKTPDGWILKYGSRRALCEIKSPRDDELDDLLDEQLAANPHAPVVSASFVRRENRAALRIAGRVGDAVSQFNSVNRDRAFPNVLVFVNYPDGWHIGDLHEVLTGYFLAVGGEQFATEVATSKRKIGDARRKTIDLYVWIDRRQRRVTGWLLGQADKRHDLTIKDLFLPLLRQPRCPD